MRCWSMIIHIIFELYIFYLDYIYYKSSKKLCSNDIGESGISGCDEMKRNFMIFEGIKIFVQVIVLAIMYTLCKNNVGSYNYVIMFLFFLYRAFGFYHCLRGTYIDLQVDTLTAGLAEIDSTFNPTNGCLPFPYFEIIFQLSFNLLLGGYHTKLQKALFKTS